MAYRRAERSGTALARLWPVGLIALLCLGAMLAQDCYGAQDIAFRKRWGFVVGWMRFYPSAFHGDGFDWGWQRPAMLFTHGFWHLGWLHLAVNMAMLAVFGALAIRRVGPWRFLLLYLAVMPLAALAYAWANGPEGTMAGASGAIHGVAGAVTVWALIDGQTGRAILRVGAVVALNLWFWWLTGGNFAWQLHLAGLGLGAAAAPLLRSPVPAS
jgi:rhomboid protease GluP